MISPLIMTPCPSCECGPISEGMGKVGGHAFGASRVQVPYGMLYWSCWSVERSLVGKRMQRVSHRGLASAHTNFSKPSWIFYVGVCRRYCTMTDSLQLGTTSLVSLFL